MKNIALGLGLALALTVACVSSATAAVVTMNFAGGGGFTPGLPGGGTFSGQVEFDTNLALPFGTSSFNNAYSSIDVTFNETGAPYRVVSGPTPTTNTLTQVELVGGGDAFLSNFAGSFGATGTALADPVNFYLELRFNDNTIFSDPTNLFELVGSNGTLTLADINFISLVVEYDDQTIFTNSIYRYNFFTRFDISGSSSTAIPLPAALPLLAGGLGLFGLMGWRRKRKVVAAI